MGSNAATQFKPGEVWRGNAGGRPASAKTMSVEARKFGIEAIHALVKTMRSETGTTRIAAARELLDRGFGKAQATIDLTVMKQVGQMSLEELTELEERMLGLAQMAAIETPKDDLFAAVEDDALGPRVELQPEPVEIAR